MDLKSLGSEIEQANRKAAERTITAEAVLVDVKPVSRAIPGFKTDLITHTWPPISWERIVRVQKTAVIIAIELEGLTDIPHRAKRLVRRQEVCVGSNHQ